MSLAGMQRSGSNAFVAWHLDRGYTPQQTQSALAFRFGGEEAADRRAAYSAGLQAWRAAQALQAGFSPPPDASIPSGGGAPQGYVYTVTMDVVNVPSREGGRAGLTMQIYSEVPLYDVDIRSRVIGELPGFAVSNAGRPGYEGWSSHAQPENIYILSVERGLA